jgi:integrase
MANKLTKRKDGNYLKRVTDPRTGKLVNFYGKTMREVNEKLMAYQSRVQHGRTFREVAEEWWESAEPALADQTVRVYKPALRRSIDEFGDQYVQEIRARQITAFLARLAHEDFAQKTLLTQRSIINQILRHAVNENDIDHNPCMDVQMPKNLRKTRREPATEAEESIIRDTGDGWLFPVISINTGMRKGEILALQWKDVDFDNNIIYVSKSLSHDNNRPVVKKPKTEAGERLVPLLDDLKEVLLKVSPRVPDHYIISDDGVNPMTDTRYARLYKLYKKEHGISCTSHQIRHSFATMAFENDVPEKALQEIIGHKQLSTTLDLYAKFRRKSLEEAAKKLNRKR